MREFTVALTESFQNGLRPDERMPRNTQYMLIADGVVFRATGLEGYEDISDPFQGNLAFDYPYPMIYRGKYLSLLLERNRIGLIDESSLPWNVTYYDSDRAIPSGGIWQVMDYNNSFYLYNGSCIVALLSGEDGLLVNTDIQANSGIDFKGRAVVGGIRPDEVWSGIWDNIFHFWRERNGHLPNSVTHKPDKSYVMWGAIGGGDFPLWLFKPDMVEKGNVEYGSYDDISNESYLINQLRQNQFGFMPMPFQGDVLCVKTLGNGVMVYGKDAIVYMPHFNGRTVGNEQIPPTFGIRHIASIGVAERGAVGGTDSNHIFIDDSGYLWTIDSELALNKIGYKEFFYPMLGNDIQVDYAEQESEFYITDGVDSFVLANGLSRIDQKPTSVFHTQGGLVGVNTDNNDNSVFLKTNTFDMGIRGVKTIVNVNIAYESVEDLEVAIEYRFSSNNPFQRTNFQKVNKEGVAYTRTHGLEFRLILRCEDKTSFLIDYVNIRWQADDKRNVRGLGAVQSSS